MPHAGPTVDRRLDRLGQLDVALHLVPIREAKPERGRIGIGPRGDLDQLEHDELVDEAVGVVGEEEPAILDDADLGDVDLGGVLQAKAAHRGDRELGDARHDAMLPDRHVP